MFSSLTFVVFMSATLVFFSKELGDFVKKLFAIQSVALFLPLFIVSLFLVIYDGIVGQFLVYVWLALHTWPVLLAKGLPFPVLFSAFFSILLLTLPALLTVWILHIWWKRKYNLPFRSSYTMGMMIWLFFTGVFLV